VTARTLRLTPRLARYLDAHTVRESALERRLRAVTQRMPDAGLQIGAAQAALMRLLVRAIGARRCIEIGTFTGYSALAVARALPRGGRIVCCDLSREWTDIARRYWKKARVHKKISLRLGPALDPARPRPPSTLAPSWRRSHTTRLIPAVLGASASSRIAVPL